MTLDILDDGWGCKGENSGVPNKYWMKTIFRTSK